MTTAQPVLIVSARYADEVAVAAAAIDLVPRIERRPEKAAERFAAEPVRVVVVDARGALAPGIAAARALGDAVEARQGAMLVLLSRGDGGATAAAHDAGATGVLVSPFGNDAFANALRLAMRHAGRLADAASAPESVVASGRHDLLTGLATGDRLQGWIDETVAAQGEPVFVLAVGVGRFAQINAAYGREVADRVLTAVGLRLSQIVDAREQKRLCGGGCLLARLAAAEFAVAMTGEVTLGHATAMAESLAKAFETPFLIEDYVIHLSARVGIAGVEADAMDDAGALIRQASSALALARAGDAGTIEIFRSDPAGDPLTRLANLESDLHLAIEMGNIAVLFQPQLAFASEQIVGVEALVRWDHPEHGLLPAETLLGTAASAELAIKLGMQEAASWTGAAARLRLSVNVTAADLADPGFASALDASRAAAGLELNRLTVEVTEGAFISDIHGAVSLLATLRSTGMKVALDDFGTGYSSLAWMARLPIDTIKLDRSFTLGLTGAPRERVVVETMVRLSKQLGLNVIAEGVEDDVLLEAARLAGCDGIQGYRVAAAMDGKALLAFCEGWQESGLSG